MRDKLIRLLDTDIECSTGDTGECDSCEYFIPQSNDVCVRRLIEFTADHLLANNVIVVPVKPGDTVYTISRGRIKEWKVFFIGLNSLGAFTFHLADENFENSRSVWDKEIGKTVFLTEEDAINELKERKSR